MKKISIQHLTRLLALMLLICTVVTLGACNKQPPAVTPSESDNGGERETETSDPDDMFQKIYDELPNNLNYSGKELQIVIRKEARFADEFIAEDSKGSIVNSAVFKRNLEVMERLGLEVTYSTIDNVHGPWDAISTSITSSACEYDIAIGSSAQATKFALQGQYRNLRNNQYIDLTKEYWSQGLLENMTLAGATYFATGSISPYFYDSAFVIYFNRDLCENYQIFADDLYAAVSDGKWTLDHMVSTTKDVYSDLNGDGIADSGDRYGFGLQVTSATDGFFSSCNIPCTEVKSNGNLQMNINIERLGTVVDKLNTFLWDNKGVVALAENEKYVTDTVFGMDKMFSNNQLLFVTDWLYSTSTSTLRDMESDFGILPYPKYDEAQTQYYTYAHDQLSVVGIPVTASEDRLDMIGAFLEASASGGQNIVMPVYYEKALTGRYVRDPESVETLNIIVRNISNDSIWFLKYSAVTPLLREQVWKHKSDYASTYQSSALSTNLYLSTLRDAYAKYADR